MTEPVPAEKIRAMRDTLAEATRYAACNPGESVVLADGVAGELAVMACRHDAAGRDKEPWFRMSETLSHGCRVIRCDPEVFNAACLVVSSELLSIGSWRVCRSDV